METLPLDYADDGSTYCDSDCDSNCDCTCHGCSDDDYDTSFYDQAPNPFNIAMLTPGAEITIDLGSDDEDPSDPDVTLEWATNPR